MKKTFLAILSVLFVLTACTGDKHFISDAAYYEQVQKDLQLKQEQLPNGDFFEVLNRTDLTTYEKEALSFLYAYLPQSDIVDKTGDYYLENVRLTQQAVEEMPWGKSLDESLIRFFVLPIRVNNEPLDDSRKVFFEELKDRVKNLSLFDAIVEVNHWCHEKVVYTPSDGRTSSPLQSVRTAFGRCGEESTFCVAALRSVGIPARQVYTPRWAHTDDNHAWVEAWVDGGWHFLGACEPEPVLDLGWFNAPASRGMMMHTKVFGNYNGAEEIMLRKPNFTEINVIDNYAKSARMDLQVVDASGKPVQDAKVQFKVYNYAEFYTVATKFTDAEGKTFLTSGLGDMLVWVSKDGKWGYDKLSFGKESSKTIKLDKTEKDGYAVDFDIVPPPESYNLPEVTPEQRANNDKLMAREDSIRNAYVATMYNHEKAVKWCLDNQVDTTDVPKLLERSRGNHASIIGFLKASEDKAEAIALLKSLSQKDLRDVPQEIITSHLNNTKKVEGIDAKIYHEYVLCPRVELEALTNYKEFFQQTLSADQQKEFSTPGNLTKWVKENITLNEDLNVTSVPVSPAGVWKSRVADTRSRGIFFVSVLRSLGVPAQLDPVTGKAQYMENGEWQDADFEKGAPAAKSKGTVHATYEPTKQNMNPRYYNHFTISKFEDGEFSLLSFDEGDIDMGGGSDYENMLKKGLKLDTGYYMLTSGSRQRDGSILTRVVFFNVDENKDTLIELQMRKRNAGLDVIGKVEKDLEYKPLALNEKDKKVENTDSNPVKISSMAADGWYVCAVLGVNEEPTNHVLRDIAALKTQFEQDAMPILFVFPDQEGLAKFRLQDFPGLPKTVVWGMDKDAAIQNTLAAAAKLSNAKQLPIVVIANTDGRVVFVSQGYTIGMGEQLMEIVHQL